MALRVEQGEGAKDRCAMLSPVVLQRLRAWRRVGHAPGQDAAERLAPFPGLDPKETLSARQFNRVTNAAAAGVAKRATTHMLRHSFGAHVYLGGLREHDRALLTDPQTSGGLLVQCGPDAVDAVLSMFREERFDRTAVIGEITASTPGIVVQ